jgi:SH3-like domain-containing protein
MTTNLACYITVNNASRITVSLKDVTRIIEHSKDEESTTCWLHFNSGNPVHVDEEYDNVLQDWIEYHKTHF